MSEERRRLDKQTMGIAAGWPLEASRGSLEELRRSVQQLMDIEAIKQLKHAYFRCIDTCNHEELATLFCEDVLVHFRGGTYEWKLRGRDEYVASIRKAFTRAAIGHHNGHQPEIQILSETEATGIWYLADHMWILRANYLTSGTALYWDRYRKENGAWRIAETRYERLYESGKVLDEAPVFSAHYLGRYGSEVPDA
jgi:hypothetical protein